ncbi:MAG: hypothetical protein MRY76_00540 [Pseudomonadales bacterium]|nr:hypothetical protein [Pseudomonadales bacterium]
MGSSDAIHMPVFPVRPGGFQVFVRQGLKIQGFEQQGVVYSTRGQRNGKACRRGVESLPQWQGKILPLLIQAIDIYSY